MSTTTIFALITIFIGFFMVISGTRLIEKESEPQLHRKGIARSFMGLSIMLSGIPMIK